jgi:hypothetical protein
VTFGFILILSGIRLVEIPRGTLIIEIAVAVGGLVLLAWIVTQMRQRRLLTHSAAQTDPV